MFEKKRICVVIPAYNEGSQIASVTAGMPDFVDRMVIVNDASTDNTAEVVRGLAEKDPRIHLLNHAENQGCGGALVTGYEWCRDHTDDDIVVRMDGDGQMAPENLAELVAPVAREEVDYAKGNRFFSGDAYEKMPRIRYFGNAFLSLLSKISSGYWHIADFQSGYTAMGRRVLNTIDWQSMYRRYGQPNDLIIRLNIYNFRIRDIPVETIYDVGEKSSMKVRKVMFTIGWLLVRMFFWRMKEKYIIRDFHPLVFFYFFGAVSGILSALLFGRIFWYLMAFGHIPRINALAAMFCFMSMTQFTLFAMWFDMEANKDLK